MVDLPVMLQVRNRKAVVVGSGVVARRRATALIECGARVTVIAPHFDEHWLQIPVDRKSTKYEPGDLAGAFLVVIATDDATVNQTIARDAHELGVLVNRTDEPDTGHFSVMAHERCGPITVGVATGGISAAAAARIRDQLCEALDHDWVLLLETVAPYRTQLQAKVHNTHRRQEALIRLTNALAMELLKTQGQAALNDYCTAIVKEVEQP